MGYFIEFWYAKNQLHSTGYVMCAGVEDAIEHAGSVLRERGCSFARVFDQSGKSLLRTVGRDGRCSAPPRGAASHVCESKPSFALVAGFVACTIAWLASIVAIATSSRPWLNVLIALAGLLFGGASCRIYNLIVSREKG